MFVCRTKKWGNSIGLLIPKQEADRLNLHENRDVVVDIVGKENPFKELYGFGRQKKITRQEFLEIRKLLESKRF
jgi:antitoxin component of MazEF toxin-antitoxin module